jgi:hypothetical protein
MGAGKPDRRAPLGLSAARPIAQRVGTQYPRRRDIAVFGDVQERPGFLVDPPQTGVPQFAASASILARVIPPVAMRSMAFTIRAGST